MPETQPGGPPSFEELQSRLVKSVKEGGPDAMRKGTLVVLPSISFASVELRKIIGIQYYEDRMLYTLLLLRNPDLRIVFITSVEVDPAIVDYYLDFLPDAAGARDRLTMISVGDPEPSALTGKILSNQEAVESIRMAIGENGGYIYPFNVTNLERRFAERVGLPLFGPHPDLVSLGSKSGSRQVAKTAGVPVLPGREDIFSMDDLEEAITAIKKESDRADAVVIKLNNGFSGQGNAIVDLRTLRFPIEETPTVFCATEESWSSFAAKIADEGAIVEELLRSPSLMSPSVQLRIDPSGSIETLSSHDQILGGPDDQVYLGCRFPAKSEYRRRILDMGLQTAKTLAFAGVFGNFGIDFVIVPGENEPEVYLSEINLRVGGTTHPFGMARLVTEAEYQFSSGGLLADGTSKFYVGTDNLKSERYVGMTPAVAITALRDSGLAYDHDSRTGAALHLMGALREHGKIGTLCIANSYEAADDLYENVVSALDVAAGG